MRKYAVSDLKLMNCVAGLLPWVSYRKFHVTFETVERTSIGVSDMLMKSDDARTA